MHLSSPSQAIPLWIQVSGEAGFSSPMLAALSLSPVLRQYWWEWGASCQRNLPENQLARPGWTTQSLPDSMIEQLETVSKPLWFEDPIGFRVLATKVQRMQVLRARKKKCAFFMCVGNAGGFLMLKKGRNRWWEEERRKEEDLFFGVVWLIMRCSAGYRRIEG